MTQEENLKFNNAVKDMGLDPLLRTLAVGGFIMQQP